MTLILIALAGGGILMIVSALENTSLMQTFRNVLSGKPLATGSQDTGASSTGITTIPGPTAGIWPKGTRLPVPFGQCPTGWKDVGSFAGVEWCESQSDTAPPGPSSGAFPSGTVLPLVPGDTSCPSGWNNVGSVLGITWCKKN
jgi:hypothetical protein